MEDSQTTAARLRVQQDQIKGDLEKVKNLETRIAKEMEQAQDKVVSMEDDIDNKFTRTDDLKSQFDYEKQRMGKIKKFLQAYKNGLSKQITYHSMKHDTKKN